MKPHNHQDQEEKTSGNSNGNLIMAINKPQTQMGKQSQQQTIVVKGANGIAVPSGMSKVQSNISVINVLSSSGNSYNRLPSRGTVNGVTRQTSKHNGNNLIRNQQQAHQAQGTKNYSASTSELFYAKRQQNAINPLQHQQSQLSLQNYQMSSPTPTPQQQQNSNSSSPYAVQQSIVLSQPTSKPSIWQQQNTGSSQQSATGSGRARIVVIGQANNIVDSFASNPQQQLNNMNMPLSAQNNSNSQQQYNQYLNTGQNGKLLASASNSLSNNFFINSIIPANPSNNDSAQQTPSSSTTSNLIPSRALTPHIQQTIQNQMVPQQIATKQSLSVKNLTSERGVSGAKMMPQQNGFKLDSGSTVPINHNQGYSKAMQNRNFYPPVMGQAQGYAANSLTPTPASQNPLNQSLEQQQKQFSQHRMISSSSESLQGPNNQSQNASNHKNSVVTQGSVPDQAYLTKVIQKHQLSKFKGKGHKTLDGSFNNGGAQNNNTSLMQHSQLSQSAENIKQSQSTQVTPMGGSQVKDFGVYMRQRSLANTSGLRPVRKTATATAMATISVSPSTNNVQVLDSAPQTQLVMLQEHQARTPGRATSSGTTGKSQLSKRIPHVSLRVIKNMTPTPVLSQNQSLMQSRDGVQSRGMGQPAKSQAELLGEGGRRLKNRHQLKHNTSLESGKAQAKSNNIKVDKVVISRTIDYEQDNWTKDPSQLSLVSPATNVSEHQQHQLPGAPTSKLQTLQLVDKTNNALLMIPKRSNKFTSQQQSQQQQKEKLDRKSIETKSARNLKQALLESINYDNDQDQESSRRDQLTHHPKGSTPISVPIKQKKQVASTTQTSKRTFRPSGRSVPRKDRQQQSQHNSDNSSQGPMALIMRQKFYEGPAQKTASSIESKGSSSPQTSVNASLQHKTSNSSRSVYPQQSGSGRKQRKLFNQDLTELNFNKRQQDPLLMVAPKKNSGRTGSQINSQQDNQSNRDSLEEVILAQQIKFNSNDIDEVSLPSMTSLVIPSNKKLEKNSPNSKLTESFYVNSLDAHPALMETIQQDTSSQVDKQNNSDGKILRHSTLKLNQNAVLSEDSESNVESTQLASLQIKVDLELPPSTVTHEKLLRLSDLEPKSNQAMQVEENDLPSFPQPSQAQQQVTQNVQGVQGMMAVQVKSSHGVGSFQRSDLAKGGTTSSRNNGVANLQKLKAQVEIDVEANLNGSQENKDQQSPQSNNAPLTSIYDNTNSMTSQKNQIGPRHGNNIFSFGNIQPEFYEQQAIMIEKKSDQYHNHVQQRKGTQRQGDEVEGSGGYMIDSGALYRNSQRENQILIVSKRKSRASSRTDQHNYQSNAYDGGDEGRHQQLSQHSVDEQDADFEKSSMRTADFQKVAQLGIKITNSTQAAAVLSSSKHSTGKTPKFHLSPRAGSLANSMMHKSLLQTATVDDEELNSSQYQDNTVQQQNRQSNKRRNMLDSQTSDEIYKVVNDFHQRNHRLHYDVESAVTDPESSLGLNEQEGFSDEDDEGMIEILLNNQLSQHYIGPFDQQEWYQRKLQDLRAKNNSFSLAKQSHSAANLNRPHQQNILYMNNQSNSNYNQALKASKVANYYNIPKQNHSGQQLNQYNDQNHQQVKKPLRSINSGAGNPHNKGFQQQNQQLNQNQQFEMISYQLPNQTKAQQRQEQQFAKRAQSNQKNRVSHKQQSNHNYPVISTEAKQTHAIETNKQYSLRRGAYPQKTTQLGKNGAQMQQSKSQSRINSSGHQSHHNNQQPPIYKLHSSKPQYVVPSSHASRFIEQRKSDGNGSQAAKVIGKQKGGSRGAAK